MTARIIATVPPDLPSLERGYDEHRGVPVEVIDRRLLSRRAFYRRLAEGAKSGAVLLLNGSGRQDQTVAALLRRRRHPSRVVISECTWRSGTSGIDRFARRIGIRLIDGRSVTYCVLSSAELELFPRTWGVDPARVVFTQYCHTIPPAELARPPELGAGVFAGGDSMRDYAPLIAAAAALGVPLRLAVKERVPHADEQPLVTAGPVPRDEFFSLMTRARVVVVPLAPGVERSAGQQTILNAMALGKIVVATDSPGARDLLEDGTSGFIVPPGDAEAMENTLRHVLDTGHEEELDRVRRAARNLAREAFSPESYVERLLDVALQALEP
ncbi:MAG: glycosyltransferase [Gaiellaceae bacterium]